jgi:hypothetical protein
LSSFIRVNKLINNSLSKVPQFWVHRLSEQFERRNRQVVARTAVSCDLLDAEGREAVGVHFLGVCANAPALHARGAGARKVPLVEDDPLLHVVGCLQLPRCHLPKLCIFE